MFLSERRISLRLFEPATYDRLPLWEASIPGIVSVRFRAENQGQQILLERAKEEFEDILFDPQHDWQSIQPAVKKRKKIDAQPPEES